LQYHFIAFHHTQQYSILQEFPHKTLAHCPTSAWLKQQKFQENKLHDAGTSITFESKTMLSEAEITKVIAPERHQY